MSNIRSSRVHQLVALALIVLLTATVLLGAVAAGDAVASGNLPGFPRTGTLAGISTSPGGDYGGNGMEVAGISTSPGRP
jgi:hypothetical protein